MQTEEEKDSLKSPAKHGRIKEKRNTVYDDVFRTMIEKMPQLIVPFINEVFGTDYPNDVEITRLDGTNYRTGKKIISDARLRICDKIYHIECQSKPDKRMIIRMLEYDISCALDNLQLTDEVQTLEFPNSCVLFLRGTGPRELNLKCVFQNGDSIMYRVPCVYESEYTKEEIFEKDLLFLLPYYVIRFEALKKTHAFDETFYDEIQAISDQLNQLSAENEDSTLYADLADMFVSIAEQVLRNLKDVSDKVGEIMKGKVLELKSERLLREGREEGYLSFWKLIRAGVLTVDQALDAVADKADFQRWMNLQK